MMTMYAKHFVLNTERLKYRVVIGGIFIVSYFIFNFWLGARTTNIFELVMIPGILSILDCLINVTYYTDTRRKLFLTPQIHTKTYTVFLRK